MKVIYICLLLGVLLGSSLHAKNVLQSFQQNDYVVKMERVELVSYDTKFITHPAVTTYKYNRTCPAVNATFTVIQDVNDADLVIQAYKFMSNEYRIFPLRFQTKLCDVLSYDMIGLTSMLQCGNFVGCPVKKNFKYNVCKWTINQAMFPPFVPNGKYMVEVKAILHDDVYGTLQGYGVIERPLI